MENNLGDRSPLKAVAEAKGARVPQVALAWVLDQGDDVAVIPGAKTRVHLNDNPGTLHLVLTVMGRERLDAVIPADIVDGEGNQPAQLAKVNR